MRNIEAFEIDEKRILLMDEGWWILNEGIWTGFMEDASFDFLRSFEGGSQQKFI